MSTFSLTNHFLIAAPQLDDPFFGRSVVYVCEHSSQGALGLVINRPMPLDLEHLLRKVDLPLAREDLAAEPVFHGGPVQTERGFVLHDAMAAHSVEKILDFHPSPASVEIQHAQAVRSMTGEHNSVYASTLAIAGGGLEMTTSKDILEAFAMGGGPRRVLVALGYASWDEGQLEDEIAANTWLTVTAEPDIIFHTPPALRWDRALALLGVQPWQLSAQAGRA